MDKTVLKALQDMKDHFGTGIFHKGNGFGRAIIDIISDKRTQYLLTIAVNKMEAYAKLERAYMANDAFALDRLIAEMAADYGVVEDAARETLEYLAQLVTDDMRGNQPASAPPEPKPANGFPAAENTKAAEVSSEPGAITTSAPPGQENAESQFQLGNCFAAGIGVAKDEKKAFECYMNAAVQRHAGAQYQVARCYAGGMGAGMDEKKAAEWYGKAAENGFIEAQYQLGLRFLSGTGMAKNERRAVEWLAKAAVKGHAGAQFNLAKCYLNGYGIFADSNDAFEWFSHAASQGHPEAQYYLGVCYLKGYGAAADTALAVKLFRLSAESGYYEAQLALGKCYAAGVGFEKDVKKAIEWLTIAAGQGSAEARRMLGKYYTDGDGDRDRNGDVNTATPRISIETERHKPQRLQTIIDRIFKTNSK